MLTSLFLATVLATQPQDQASRIEYKDGLYNITGIHKIESVLVFLQAKTPEGQKLIIHESPPPELRAPFTYENVDYPQLLTLLQAQFSIQIMPQLNDRDSSEWHMYWAEGAPSKDVVRLYERAGMVFLEVSDATVEDIAKRVQALLDERALEEFQSHGYGREDRIAKLSVMVDAADLSPQYPTMTRAVIKQDGRNRAAAAQKKRTVWNLTFLNGGPPDLANPFGAAVNEGRTGYDPVKLALALSNAYSEPGDKGKKTKVQAVGNSLVIEGDLADVTEIERLLATQIDIAQSQVVLELDSYLISSTRKTAAEDDLAARRLLIGQEVARAYKAAYLDALSMSLIELDEPIQCAMERRENDICTITLFERVGINPSSQRIVGLTDMLFYLAYCPEDQFREIYPATLYAQFKAVHGQVEELVVNPLEDQNKDLYTDVKNLNDWFLATACRLKKSEMEKLPLVSPLIKSFASEGKSCETAEDKLTRTAIEEFLVLWLVNSHKKLGDVLDSPAADSRYSSFVDKQRANISNVYTEIGLVKSNDSLTPQWQALLTGNRAHRLVRASMVVDELLESGVGALDKEARVLVDDVLDRWIGMKVLPSGQKTSFGVKFAGRSRLATTSRAPAFSGAEAQTFFPYQPPTPLDKNQTLDLLKGDTTGTAIDALFNQAATQPYYRMLAPGIQFAALSTMLPSGAGAELKVQLGVTIDPSDENKAGTASFDKPSPVDLVRVLRTETQIQARSLDTTSISSLKLTVSAPGKRDWEFPVLSQILPIRSWFVGPTRDMTKQHEAIVLVRVTVVPRAMDLASRFIGS